MRIRILNKRWRLRFAPNLANRGDCDGPATKHKEIRVLSGLRGEERLEVLIHEMLHAAGWHIPSSGSARTNPITTTSAVNAGEP